MLNRIRGRHVAEVLENRRRFCDQTGVKYDDVVYHVISYDQDKRLIISPKLLKLTRPDITTSFC